MSYDAKIHTSDGLVFAADSEFIDYLSKMMKPTSDELLPCPFCGGKAHIRRKIAYRRNDEHPKEIVFDFEEDYGDVAHEVDVFDWRFGFQVLCGRCKAKTIYKWGQWHAYTDEQLETLDREDFHNHTPNSDDEPAKLKAVELWNRRMTMKPTSNERREVAERLSVYSHDFDFGKSNPFYYVEKAVFGNVDRHPYCDVFARLADLIDPTCNAIYKGRQDNYNVCYGCSVCSFGWFENVHDMPYSYCPHCGARVV